MQSSFHLINHFHKSNLATQQHAQANEALFAPAAMTSSYFDPAATALCKAPIRVAVLQDFPQRMPAGHRKIKESSVELTLRFQHYLALRKITKCKSRGFAGAMNFLLAETLGDYIDTHIGQRIQISDLAAIANLSVGHFHHAFSATMGVTPHAYIMVRRIELAQDLIDTTDASLIKIGVALGFNDSPHFSREFRRRVGMAPSAWRRQRRELVAAP